MEIIREIKFRAWNEKEKKMHTSYLECHLIALMEDSPRIHIPKSEATEEKWIDVQLEQYTGLHDKNGKEIYDRDIARYHNGFLNIEMKVQILYAGSGFFIEHIGESGTRNFKEDFGLIPLSKMSETLEVIGNIHENSELLEEK